jgi:hypothetical protein
MDRKEGSSYHTLIEYFLLMHQKQQASDKLVYYDRKGHRFEKTVGRQEVDEALKVFDGAPRAVARSTGGIIRAIPHQLVMYDAVEGGKTTPQIRIKVKFKEYKRDSQGRWIFHESVVGSKILTVEELANPFSYQLDGQQRFMLDFGQGTVPVYVFRYAIEPSGKILALFAELDAVKQAILQPPGNQITVQAYFIDRDLLRYACTSNRFEQDEYQLALKNYNMLKSSGEEIFPKTLRFSEPVTIKTGISYQEFRHLISKEAKKNKPKDMQLPTKTIFKDQDDELVPFGLLEETH